jgi:hypothetical protein
MRPPPHDEGPRRRTEGPEIVGAGRQNDMTNIRPSNDRIRERRRHFRPEIVAYLEALDRRREAEWRLQPLADFIDTAA